jgi:hypothetical protein
VINKQVHIYAIVFDVPREYRWIGGFEHQLLYSERIDESGRHISSPWLNLFGNAFALDHDNISAGIEEPFRLRDRQLGSRIPSAANSAAAVAPPAPN